MIVVLIIALLLFLYFTLSNNDGTETPQLIKIGYGSYPYPPLHYYDSSGELVGFDIDLAREVALLMETEIEFIPINWSENKDLLATGEVDVLWGGLERASLDEKVVKFTRSYLRSNIVLLTTEDKEYSKFEDLQGLNVCVLNFTPAFNYFQVYNRDVIKSRRSYSPPEYRSLITTLTSGEYDCMITDTSFASFFRKLDPDVTYKMSDSVIGSNYAVGVRTEDTKLFESLQNALDELEANGFISRLVEKWIAYGPQT